jgi:segregation and condensation protein B
MKVVIVASNMAESVKNLKAVEPTQLYKACAYKDDESFEMVREWDVSGGKVRVWCKTAGVKSSMNARLSEVLGRPVYRKSVFCLTGQSGETYVDFDQSVWKAFAQSNVYAAEDGTQNEEKQENIQKKSSLHALPTDNDGIMPESEYENDVDGEGVEAGCEDGDGEREDGDGGREDGDGEDGEDGDGEDGDDDDGEDGDDDDGDVGVDDADVDVDADADDEDADRDEDDEDGVVNVGGKMSNMFPSLLDRALKVGVALDGHEPANAELIEQIGLLTMNELSDDEYFPYSDEEDPKPAAHALE